MKNAFSLIETLLTLVIIGVIAAVSVTVFKPEKYKAAAFLASRQKVYYMVNEATKAIMLQCTDRMNLEKIYSNCNKTSGTHAFGTGENAIYALYMVGTTGAASTANGNCSAGTAGASTLRLKNGMCLYFNISSNKYITVDVNGNAGPNTENVDKMYLYFDYAKGITTDAP